MISGVLAVVQVDNALQQSSHLAVTPTPLIAFVTVQRRSHVHTSFFVPVSPMATQFRMYIVRHGETEWNRTRRIQGQLDVPLNETGLRQAMLAAEALKDIPFVRAFSSDLRRAFKVITSRLLGLQVELICSQTAECILQYHPDTVLELDASIRERVRLRCLHLELITRAQFRCPSSAH